MYREYLYKTSVVVLFISVAWCLTSNGLKAPKTRIDGSDESWYDDIKGRMEQRAKQYARDALRSAVQSTMDNTIGHVNTKENEEDEYIYINKHGKTLGQILDAKLTADEKEKEQERRVHTYFILLISGLIIFVVTCAILLLCCVYNRLYKYIALLNSVVWFIWFVYTVVKYYQEYCEWVDDD